MTPLHIALASSFVATAVDHELLVRQIEARAEAPPGAPGAPLPVLLVPALDAKAKDVRDVLADVQSLGITASVATSSAADHCAVVAHATDLGWSVSRTASCGDPPPPPLLQGPAIDLSMTPTPAVRTRAPVDYKRVTRGGLITTAVGGAIVLGGIVEGVLTAPDCSQYCADPGAAVLGMLMVFAGAPVVGTGLIVTVVGVTGTEVQRSQQTPRGAVGVSGRF